VRRRHDVSPRRAAGWLPIATLAAVVVGGLWIGGQRMLSERAARAAFPTTEGTLAVPGLDAPLEILRDRRGIPHVEARGEQDAWFGLGFVHAQDRPGEMLWLRALARGRSAERVGERGLSHDRLIRTIGIPQLANEQLERLDARTRNVLSAYARGVDARLARIREGSADPPPGLDAESLEVWTPADTLAILKWVAWSTGAGLETGVVLSDLIERLGGVGARPFFPTGRGVEGAALEAELPPDPIGRSESAAAALRSTHGPILDVSGWVLGARHTASGAPLLAADFHLPPSIPALLYEAQVRGGMLDVAGVTLPGVPIFWAGRTPSLAWAATPARAVSADLYQESLREDRRKPGPLLNKKVPPEILNTVVAIDEPGKLSDTIVAHLNLKLEERQELIRVRSAVGGPREETLVVRSTGHGPLVNALLDSPPPEQARQPLALAWTGAQPGDGLGALLAVARARNLQEARAALPRHHEPIIALLLADREGAIGLQIAGWIPRRPLPTGLVPVPSHMRVFDWRAPIDFASLPSQWLEPDSPSEPPEDGDLGFLLAADNALVDEFPAARIEWLWRTGRRARRIEGLLSEQALRGGVDLREAAAIQADLTSPAALELVQRMLRVAGDRSQLGPEVVEVMETLEDWDGAMEVDSRGAAVYQVLVQELGRALFEGPIGRPLLDRYLAIPQSDPVAVVSRIVELADTEPRGGGWADPERVRSALHESLRRTWRGLSFRLGPNRDRWVWGRLNRIAFRPLLGLPAGESDEPLIGPMPIGGDASTIAVSRWAAARPFEAEFASTLRLVVDLAAPDRMLSLLAPGQSGHRLHPHYDDGIASWRSGRPRLFPTSEFLVEEECIERLRLEPAS